MTAPDPVADQTWQHRLNGRQVQIRMVDARYVYVRAARQSRILLDAFRRDYVLFTEEPSDAA